MSQDTPRNAPASYSPADLARRLGVSAPTVQRWVDQGHLLAWKTVGGHRRIDAESAERFVAQRALAVTPAEPAAGPAAAAAGPLSVLIVDDNEDDRDVLGALIDSAFPGATLAVADNGFDALTRIGQAPPQVLITDIVMPHMNGIEMLRHLCANDQVRPPVVIAVSSRTAQEVQALGGLPEGVLLAAKPLLPAPFIARLRAAVAQALLPGQSGEPAPESR